MSYMVCMNSLIYIFSLLIYANKSYTILFQYYLWCMININSDMIICDSHFLQMILYFYCIYLNPVLII